jgi:hypothetical protein
MPLFRLSLRRAALTAALLLFSLPLFAAQAYHLELEANPASAFPWLGKFGSSVEIHVYPSGVRADVLWLDAFSKNGAAAVIVANPLARMYVDVPVADIAPTLMKLAGNAGALERSLAPQLGPSVRGKIAGIAATRHRLVYGPSGWIDIWTTDVIPENAQFRRIVDQLVRGISPGTAAVARKIRGTPLFVELNFRRFRAVPLLKVKKLTFTVDADEEKDALELGSFYMRAPLLDKLLSQ